MTAIIGFLGFGFIIIPGCLVSAHRITIDGGDAIGLDLALMLALLKRPAHLLGIVDGFHLPWTVVKDNMRSGYAEWRECYANRPH